MTRLLLAAALLLAQACAFAQSSSSSPTGASGTSVVLIRQSGTTLPSTCTVGQIFFKTNATAGQNIYECASSNTWTQQAGGLNSTLTSAHLFVGSAGNVATDVAMSGDATMANTGALSLNNPSLHSGYLSTTKTADVAGVTANLLCKINSTGNVVNAVTSDVGILGVCVSTSTSGNPVEVATRGIVNCVADNTTVVGDRLIVGTSTAGRCRDSGQTDSTSISSSTQVIGVALTVATVGNPVSVQLFGPGHYGELINVANATGNLTVSHLNSGTSAGNTTFWRGDGVWATPAGGGGSTSWLVKTTTYTAASGDKIVADSSGAAFTITLPLAPSTGDNVEVKSGGSATANTVTLARNGQTIMGSASDLALDTSNIDVIVVFDGSTWRF